MVRTPFCPWLLVLLCLGLAACQRQVQAPGDPVAAVKGLAAAIRDDDMVRYARLSVPPDLFERQARRWQVEVAAAPPPTDAERREYDRWMGRLTEPGAEDKLIRSLDSRMGKVDPELKARWPLMRASADIFLKGLIQANATFDPDQRAHALALESALLAGVDPQRLADRERAHSAVRIMVATARELDLPTVDRQRQLGMVEAMAKGSVLLKGLKKIALVYGIDVNAALAQLQARVVSADADQARVEVTYQLMGQKVSFDLPLLRRQGRWYPANAIREAEAGLAAPAPPAIAAPASVAPHE